MADIVKSVGIDIGTSTTQLIFSRLIVENLASSYAVPRIHIVDKQVTYRSEIYFTPLKSATEIDADKVLEIIKKEYETAGVNTNELQTGAVIITGDTARKQNANDVLAALSSMAGDFVVATAGPDLESVLSARGAGADKISDELHTAIANVDVGGGTSNIAVFERSNLRSTSCLDIGGRLIKINNGKISSIFPKIKDLASKHGINIEVNQKADEKILLKVCEIMADHLMQSLALKEKDSEHEKLYTNDGKPIKAEPTIKGVTFSGGVADYVYSPTLEDPFRYGDIGVLLGYAIANHSVLQNVKLHHAAETIRATVVGAGTHTTEVSGSTITYDSSRLPIKNIPILKVPEQDELSLDSFSSSIKSQTPLFCPEGSPEQIAIAFTGRNYTSFADVQKLADAIVSGAKEAMESKYPLILVVEADIGKVLGNTISVKTEKPIICIDSIKTLSGDYIDIGEPIAGGQVLPVVIKTLIFNS